MLKQRTLWSKIFLGAVGAMTLVLGSCWDSVPLAGDAFLFAGTLLVSIATVGRLWCSVFISGYKREHLITVGPYSMCRNPLYLFSLVGAIGVALATRTLTVPLVVLAAFAGYYPYTIRREERRLREIHGDAFDRYCREVPRLLPSFARFHEPEEYTIRAQPLRARWYDSLWFVWLLGVLTFITALHRHGVLPVWWRVC